MALLALGCKRRQAPPVQEVWDEEASSAETEALGALAPPWPAPTRATLDNGLLLLWLEETATPALSLRLLVPTTGRTVSISPEAIAVVMESVRTELERRGRRLGMTIAIDHAPGRVELVVHGSDEQAEETLLLVAEVLGQSASSTRLERGRKRVANGLGPAKADDIAAAALGRRLLGSAAPDERLDRGRLTALSRAALIRAWDELRDPREAVMVVHAGTAASEAREALRTFSERWRGLGRRALEKSVLARLRLPDLEQPARPRRLLSQPAAPLRAVSIRKRSGKPVIMLGRVVPTDSARARSTARLAQRVLQEEIDARLSIVGPVGLFAVRIPVSTKDPDGGVARAIAKLSTLARTRHQKQRLFQAAQLWLGARVVAASLRGEDWTDLWSEAIDLADSDHTIGIALARDAKAMLDTAPETLQKWQKRWLDPRAGEPGWEWVVVGAGDDTLRALERLTKVARPDA
jgi:hypothetical protein